jgi:hypothetical protein
MAKVVIVLETGDLENHGSTPGPQIGWTEVFSGAEDGVDDEVVPEIALDEFLVLSNIFFCYGLD